MRDKIIAMYTANFSSPCSWYKWRRQTEHWSQSDTGSQMAYDQVPFLKYIPAHDEMDTYDDWEDCMKTA